MFNWFKNNERKDSFKKRAKLFSKELKALENKYGVEIYSGYLDTADDNDIIIANKYSSEIEEVYLDDVDKSRLI